MDLSRDKENILHVVALSGGKDSTAMALRLSEVEPREYTYVCTPTGDELPELFQHWRDLGETLGKPILPVTAGISLDGLISRYNALPNWRQRWCTRQLKIEPYQAWLLKQSGKGPIVSYVGLRADEEGRAGGAYNDLPDVVMRFPMREWGWGLSDVLGYLEQKNITIPERTDCARCFFQTLGQWWILWREHPNLYTEAEAQEEQTGHTFRSPGRDTWPASLKDLRLLFEQGRVPRGTALQRDLLRNHQCRVCSL